MAQGVKPCQCGRFDVSTSDSASHEAGWLVVHGLAHCYTVPSLVGKKGQGRIISN